MRHWCTPEGNTDEHCTESKHATHYDGLDVIVNPSSQSIFPR